MISLKQDRCSYVPPGAKSLKKAPASKKTSGEDQREFSAWLTLPCLRVCDAEAEGAIVSSVVGRLVANQPYSPKTWEESASYTIWREVLKSVTDKATSESKKRVAIDLE